MVRTTVRKRGPGRPPLDAEENRERRARYLTIAAQVFAKRGYAATDVQEVADRAKVGKATVYRFFPSKIALFTSAIEHGVANLHQTVQAAMATTDHGLERVRCAVHAYLSYWEEHPEMAELLVLERAEFRGTQSQRYVRDRNQAKAEAGAQFSALIAQGLMRDAPTDRYVDVIFNLLYGTMYFNRMTGADKPIAAQVEDILDVFFHGSLTEAGRRRLAVRTKIVKDSP